MCVRVCMCARVHVLCACNSACVRVCVCVCVRVSVFACVFTVELGHVVESFISKFGIRMLYLANVEHLECVACVFSCVCVSV